MTSKKIPLGKVIVYLFLTLWAVMALLPFFWMVSTSLKVREVVHTVPIVWFPQHPGLDAYREIFNMSQFQFGVILKNSFIIAVILTFVTIASPAMAAFVFAKIPFKGREKLFLLFLSSMMIPGVVTLIPNYVIINTLGLMNSYTGVVLPFLINAFGIFLLRQAMRGVDNAYMEAAIMDGASLPRIFLRVILPMVRPTLMTLILFQFMFAWNNYLWPLIVLTDRSKWTLQIALANMQTRFGTYEHLQMAGALVTLAPILLVYLVTQRYVEQGIMIGGIKG